MANSRCRRCLRGRHHGLPAVNKPSQLRLHLRRILSPSLPLFLLQLLSPPTPAAPPASLSLRPDTAYIPSFSIKLPARESTTATPTAATALAEPTAIVAAALLQALARQLAAKRLPPPRLLCPSTGALDAVQSEADEQQQNPLLDIVGQVSPVHSLKPGRKSNNRNRPSSLFSISILSILFICYQRIIIDYEIVIIITILCLIMSWFL